MAVTPPSGAVFEAEVVAVKGHCNAGHKAGEKLRLSCWDSGGLCGYFYHDIFPYLMVPTFSGTIPWFAEGVLTLHCPDPVNQITLVARKA
jgi:uncharacterized repeat protein (TIGR04076 family)